MPHFFASTSKGLEKILQDELQNLGLKVKNIKGSTCFFETNWRGLYKAILSLRTASRVALPILDFHAYNADDLYHNIKKHDFTKYISPQQKIYFSASLKGRGPFNNSHFLCQRAKDAVVDQFYSKYSERPEVDKENHDLHVLIKVNETEVSVSLDLGGMSLSHRGYRSYAGRAPLRENLAAGLLMMTNWSGNLPLVDPMCGSGTFACEGFLIAHKIAPGLLNSDSYAFRRLKIFQEDTYFEVLDELKKEIDVKADVAIYSSDISSKAVGESEDNFQELLNLVDSIEGLKLKNFSHQNIKFKKISALDLNPSDLNISSCVMVVNPPYAVRIGESEEVEKLYEEFSRHIKNKWSPGNLWLLSGDPEFTKKMRLKAKEKFTVMNGPLECRWLHYEILPPRSSTNTEPA